MTRYWSAGYHMPGYLPEMEPFVSDNHEDVRGFLIEALDRAGDSAFEIGDYLKDQTYLDDADTLSGLMEDVNLTRDAWYDQSKDLAWWITEISAEDYAEYNVEEW